MNREIESDIRRTLLTRGVVVGADSVRAAAQSNGAVVDEQNVAAIASQLSADVRGYGPLEPFLSDSQVTDIVVNGAAEVWVDRGDGMTLTGTQFRDDFSVRRMAQRLAAFCGRRLDEASPFVDAPLAQGVRLHAMLPPLVDRISVAIRVPRHRAWSLDDLTASGFVPPDARQFLLDVVRGRHSFLISGGTGSGKTTLLNALLGELRPSERAVIVEDTRELAPRHRHVVSLQTRAPNIEGAGAVTMQDLVRQTLRMRPDRIVVGEVRGAEVIDLLTALNTGHRGGCCTVHANSASDILPRLEALAALGAMRRSSLQRLVAAALELVVHLDRDQAGRRRVAALAMVRDHGESVSVTPAFRCDPDGHVLPEAAADEWRQTVGVP
ncbi:MAG: TadA family conjugal transfer-associated ATPase [Actinomycetes bacterium]